MAVEAWAAAVMAAKLTPSLNTKPEFFDGMLLKLFVVTMAVAVGLLLSICLEIVHWRPKFRPILESWKIGPGSFFWARPLGFHSWSTGKLLPMMLVELRAPYILLPTFFVRRESRLGTHGFGMSQAGRAVPSEPRLTSRLWPSI